MAKIDPTLGDTATTPAGQVTLSIDDEPPIDVAATPPLPPRDQFVPFTKTQESQGLLAITRGAVRGDSLGMQTREVQRILLVAMDDLRTSRFKPEAALEGSPPSRAQIEASLRAGYRSVYDQAAGSDALIPRLLEPFAQFIQSNAPQLGLVGTRPRKRPASSGASGERQPPSIDDALAAVRAASAGIAELERLAALPAADAELVARAHRTASRLESLGTGEKALRAALAPEAARQRAIADAALLAEEVDAVRVALRDADPLASDADIALFWGYIRADVDTWVGARTADLPFDVALFTQAARRYIGYWLAEQAGDRPPRITYSPDAWRDAIAAVRSQIDGREQRARFEGLSGQLLGHIIRSESRRSRLAVADGAARPGATDVPLPTTRLITTGDDLRRAIGDGLSAAFTAAFAHAQDAPAGSDPAAARRHAWEFFELFTLYVRYAANTYGDHFRPELLADHGLEAQLVRAIFTRVGAGTFSDESLELLRNFFASSVSSRPTPSIEEMKPTPVPAAATTGAPSRFVPYEEGMGMREFLRAMPFKIDADLRRDFERATGYALANFERWGTLRARPEGTTSEAWDEAVAAARAAETLEDLTVEPRQQSALDAILPAYLFLAQRAAAAGMRLDLWDYLAAISPIARRMRARAEGGVITVTVPSFMRALPFRNWGYPTWARQILASRYATDVVSSTLSAHVRGAVDNPEYWDIRRYTVPLAAASGGGLSQERVLYEFAAGLLRWAHVLDNAAVITDAGGGQVTFAPAHIASRFRVQLEEDTASYAPGISPVRRVQRAAFLEAHRARQARALSHAGQFLQELSALEGFGVPLRLETPDGSATTIPELLATHDGFVRQHLLFDSLLRDRSSTSSLRSEEDLERIRAFYETLERFTREVLFSLRARAVIATPAGQSAIHFVPHIAGRTYDPTGPMGATVAASGILALAQREGWNAERVQSALFLQSLIRHARAAGNLPSTGPLQRNELRESIAPLWRDIPLSLDDALEDMERADDLMGAGSDIAPPLPLAPSSRPDLDVEDPLPLSRRDPAWEEQLLAFAEGRGIGEGRATELLAAVREYFRGTRGFRMRLRREALGRAIAAHATGADAREVDALLREALAFFPTIGVANGAEAPLRELNVDANGDPASHAALQALMRYVEYFPGEAAQGAPVPFVEDLLAEFVNLELADLPEAHLSPMLVFARARTLLSEYNRSRNVAASAGTPEEAIFPREGMLLPRLADFAAAAQRHATAGGITLSRIRQLYAAIATSNSGTVPAAPGELPNDLSRFPGGVLLTAEERAFLGNFVAHQARDLARWHHIIRDPELGIAAFVRSRYHAPALTDEMLAALATGFVDNRLTTAVPTDPLRIARMAVGNAFAPYRDAADRAALFSSTLLREWMGRVETDLAERLDFARTAIEDAAANAMPPPATADTMIAEGLEVAEISGTEELRGIERMLSDVRRMRGRPSPNPATEAWAQRVFDTIVPARIGGLAAEQRAREKELASLLARVEAVQRNIAALSIAHFTAAEVEGMDDAAARNAAAQLEAGAAILTGCTKEIAAIAAIPAQALAIVAAMESPGLPAAADTGLLASARTLKDTIAAMRATILTLSRERADTAALVVARRTAIAKQAEHEHAAELLRGALVRAQERRAAIETSLERLETRLLPDAREALASVQRFIDEEASASAKNREAFFAALAKAQGFPANVQETTSGLHAAISAARELLEGPREGTPAGTSSSLSAFLAEVDRHSSAADEAQIEETLALLDAAESLAQRAASIQGEVNALIANLTTHALMIKMTLDTEEGHLPLEGPAHLPTVYAADGSMEDGTPSPPPHLLGTPTKHFHLRARDALEAVTGGLVLSLPSGEHLLSREEASSVTSWMGRGRKADLSVRDAFGASVAIPTGQRGVRLAPLHELPKDHPFAALVGNLELLFRENSREAELLWSLSRGNGHRADGGQLRNDLLARLAAAGPLQGPAQARQTVARWAFGRQQEIIAALGNGTSAWFETAVSTIPSERHAAGRPHARPEVAPADFDAAQRRGVAQSCAQLIEQATPAFPPSRLFSAIFGYLVASNPRYTDLCWLFSSAVRHELPEAFEQFLSHFALPTILRFRGHVPDDEIEFLQREAVSAWKRFTENGEDAPEAGRITTDALRKWIDTVAHPKAETRESGMALERVRKGFRDAIKHPASRRAIAKTLLLWHAGSVDERPKLTPIVEQLLMRITLWLANRGPAAAHLPPEILHEVDAAYLAHRSEALADRTLLINATGVARADVSREFARQDRELGTLHPETAATAAHVRLQMIMAAEISSLRGTPAPGVRSILLFPEFASAITAVSLADALLPSEFSSALAALVLEYEALAPQEQERQHDAFRQRFIDLYHTQAQAGVPGHDAIIRALRASPNDHGISNAVMLTGRSDPWRVSADSWDGFTPIEKLRALLPETARVPRDRIDDYLELMERVGPQVAVALPSANEGSVPWAFRMMTGAMQLMRDIPELAGAAYLLLTVRPFSAEHPGAFTFFEEYGAALQEGPVDREVWLQRAVDRFTEPENIAALREKLRRPTDSDVTVVTPERRFPPDTSMSAARKFTGTETPWLPEPTKLALSHGAEIPATAAPPGAPLPPMTRRGDDILAARRSATAPDASYTPEIHRGLAQNYAHLLEYPQIGLARIPQGPGNWRTEYIDITQPREQVSTQRRLRVFNLSLGDFEMIDVRTLGTDDPEAIEFVPIDPLIAKANALLYLIYRDPALIRLGELVWHMTRGGLAEPFAASLRGSMAPLLDLPAADAIPLLPELQEEAVEASRRWNEGDGQAPELGLVRPESLSAWLDEVIQIKTDDLKAIRWVGELKEQMREFFAKNGPVKREAAAAYLLHRLAKARDMKALLREANDLLVGIASANTEVMIQRKKGGPGYEKGQLSAMKRYLEFRPQILADRALIHEATGRAFPERAPLLVPPDLEFSRQHPETALVLPQRKRAFIAILHDAQERFQQPLSESLFPDLMGMFTALTVARNGLSEQYERTLTSTARTYGEMTPAEQERQHATFRQRFIELYHDQAQAGVAGHDAIIRALQGQHASGTTRARYLTGRDEPWVAPPSSWNALSPMERLRLRLPEAFRVRPEFIARYRAELSRIAASGWHREKLEDLIRFLDARPDLAGVVILDNIRAWPQAKGYANVLATLQYAFEYEETPDREAWFARLIEEHLSPASIMELRGILKGKAQSDKEPGTSLVAHFGATPGENIATFLTGASEPWLPADLPGNGTKHSPGGGSNGGGGRGGATPPRGSSPTPASNNGNGGGLKQGPSGATARTMTIRQDSAKPLAGAHSAGATAAIGGIIVFDAAPEEPANGAGAIAGGSTQPTAAVPALTGAAAFVSPQIVVPATSAIRPTMAR